ncbi:hypothetical protein RCL1_002519 [Eukaryota sp. TZLM3-RCL]
MSDDIGSMAHIPSLDDDDITGQVSAPAFAPPQVQCAASLDELASYSLPPLTFTDIPASAIAFLTDAVDPALEVFEEDDVWTQDSIMSQIAHLFEKK